MTDPAMNVEALAEALAAHSHERWASWTQHMLDQIATEATLETTTCRRWLRQIATPYSELPEEEKQSDRDDAMGYITALASALGTTPEGLVHIPQIKQLHERELATAREASLILQGDDRARAVYASLRDENERLREALRPFADARENSGSALTVKQFDRALAALEEP